MQKKGMVLGSKRTHQRHKQACPVGRSNALGTGASVRNCASIHATTVLGCNEVVFDCILYKLGVIFGV
jgi:hypothetical protein